MVISLPYPKSIRLGCKYFRQENTLAYFAVGKSLRLWFESIRNVVCFTHVYYIMVNIFTLNTLAYFAIGYKRRQTFLNFT
jgi:hypothetical protein